MLNTWHTAHNNLMTVYRRGHGLCVVPCLHGSDQAELEAREAENRFVETTRQWGGGGGGGGGGRTCNPSTVVGPLRVWLAGSTGRDKTGQVK